MSLARTALFMLLQSRFCWDLPVRSSLTCHWSPHIGGDIRRRSCTTLPAFSGYALGYALSKDSPVFYGPCSQCPQGKGSRSLQCSDNVLVSFLCLNWDFTCECSTSTTDPAWGRTLQLQCLEQKTGAISVCHLMLGHVRGCVPTVGEVKPYYSFLS